MSAGQAPNGAKTPVITLLDLTNGSQMFGNGEVFSVAAGDLLVFMIQYSPATGYVQASFNCQ